MRYLKYLALLAVLVLPAAYSQAQVGIGVRIGPDYGLYNAPPVCEYGFYPDYPYDCAPYGYWGPQWFVGGVFIGAGPWYNFYYTHPGFYRPFFVGRGFGGFERFGDRDRFRGGERFRDGDRFRGGDRGFRDGGRGFSGGGHEFRSGTEFRGGGGGREFHGGGGGGGRSFSGGGHEFHGGGSGFRSGGGGFHGGGGGFHGGGGGSHGGGGHGGRR